LSAKKTGRKKRSEYRRYKKFIRGMEAVSKCAHIVSMTVEAAKMSRMYSKCLGCKHTYEKKVGGIVVKPNINDNERVLIRGRLEDITKFAKGIK